ncbi:MAG: DNA-deoxyinosine glycosylase [Ruminococcus sp.]|nr:DNA-deoxyinosine glycosylase [Ruminococcus sp.]
MKEKQTVPQRITHPIPPTYDENSEILILGSFPSVRSREMGYFYGHPQNRFWKITAALYNEPVPMTIEERRAFLLRNHIAAWDVIAQCTIIGSSDSSIKDVVPNDLEKLISGSKIGKIFVNGRKAEEYYIKYQQPVLGREAICLPSSSPANAAWSLERLVKVWGELIIGSKNV